MKMKRIMAAKALSLTPRFSGVWARVAALEPLQRFASLRETAAQRDDLLPYIRSTSRFAPPGFSYSLQTAHSLPDFDTLGYAVEIAFSVAREAAISGRVLAWNPGQGHLPVGLASRPGKKVSSVAVASRDAVQCEMAALNLSSVGFSDTGRSPFPALADCACPSNTSPNPKSSRPPCSEP